MRNPLQQLEQRREELRERLVLITDLEKLGFANPKRRLRYASKLAHVEEAIFKLRQRRLFP